MTLSYSRFFNMKGHCEGCNGYREVIADQNRLVIRVECDCGQEWSWKLFSELKLRLPEGGIMEKFFQDENARVRLSAFLNGLLFIEDEKAI